MPGTGLSRFLASAAELSGIFYSQPLGLDQYVFTRPATWGLCQQLPAQVQFSCRSTALGNSGGRGTVGPDDLEVLSNLIYSMIL